MSNFLPSNLSANYRSDSSSNTIPVSKLLMSFLSEEDGCDVLSGMEEVMGITMKVTASGLVVQHNDNVPMQIVERTLMQRWHDRVMFKSMRVSILTRSCADHRTAQLSVSQAAIVKLFSHLIQRDSGIADIIIETSGNISWYGPKEAVDLAPEIIRKLLHLYLPGHEAVSELDSPRQQGSTDVLNSFMRDMHQPPMSPLPLDWNMNPFSGASSAMSRPSVTSDEVNEELRDVRQVPRRRERMLFMVKSTDAPRLIGTRGVNKRKIEDTTNCTVTLHTESKKDGEFPVEVCGSSHQVCENAKNFIESFLAPGGTLLDYKEKAKRQHDRDRARKVHLQISPKKKNVSKPPTEAKPALSAWRSP